MYEIIFPAESYWKRPLSIWNSWAKIHWKVLTGNSHKQASHNFSIYVVITIFIKYLGQNSEVSKVSPSLLCCLNIKLTIIPIQVSLFSENGGILSLSSQDKIEIGKLKYRDKN